VRHDVNCVCDLMAGDTMVMYEPCVRHNGNVSRLRVASISRLLKIIGLF